MSDDRKSSRSSPRARTASFASFTLRRLAPAWKVFYQMKATKFAHKADDPDGATSAVMAAKPNSNSTASLRRSDRRALPDDSRLVAQREAN